MNIIAILSLVLTYYLLFNNLIQTKFNFMEFFSLINLFNYSCIIFFLLYFNQFVIIPILVTSAYLGKKIMENHPYNQISVPEFENKLIIFGLINWYLFFNFFNGTINMVIYFLN